MKATELMIGDFVTFKDCQGDEYPPICEIVGIEPDEVFAYIDGDKSACDELDVKELVGISLTPEIMKKNRFKSYNNSSYQMRENGLYLSWRNIGRLNISFGCAPITSVHIKCKFVHELQHALKLCGIDKEILFN